jgi:hypothetical protein
MTRLATRFAPYFRAVREKIATENAVPEFRAPNGRISTSATPSEVQSTTSTNNANNKVRIGENERCTYYVWYPENLNVNDIMERICGAMSPTARQITTVTPKKRTFNYFSVPVTCCYVLVETIGKYRSQIQNKPIYVSHGNGDTTILYPRLTNNPRTFKRIGYELSYNYDRKQEEDWSGTVMEKMMRRANLDPIETHFYFPQNGEPVICVVNHYWAEKHMERDYVKNKTFKEFGCAPSRPGRRLTDVNFKLEYSPSQMQQMLNELDQYSNDQQQPEVGPLELDDVLFDNYEANQNGTDELDFEPEQADHPMYVQNFDSGHLLDNQTENVISTADLQQPMHPLTQENQTEDVNDQVLFFEEQVPRPESDKNQLL